MSRSIAGETILVPIRAGVVELDSIFTLNEVGAAIWKLVEAGRSGEEIAAAIAEEFEVSRDEARQDVAIFLGSLKEAGLIRQEAEGGG